MAPGCFVWRNGTNILILTTTGRCTGRQHSTPLIFREHGDYLKGGADEPRAWYLNLQADPTVRAQIKGDRFTATARTATPEWKPELWRKMARGGSQHGHNRAATTATYNGGMRKPWKQLTIVLVAVTAAVLGNTAPALADVNALTDDKSVTVPTGWWLYTNASESYLNDRLDEHNARPTDIEIHSITASGPRFTAVMVPNSGAYAVPGWWWYYDLTYQGVINKINEHNGRLLDLEPYWDSGVLRYAIILVSNTGGAARTWWWFAGATFSALQDFVSTSNPPKRLVHFKNYWDGSTYRYVAIVIANTGSDAKSWWWSANGSLGQQECGTSQRIFHVGARETNNYDVIRVANTLPLGQSWCYYKGLTSIQQIFDIAGYQKMRPVDIDTYRMTYTNERRYDVVFISNK